MLWTVFQTGKVLKNYGMTREWNWVRSQPKRNAAGFELTFPLRFCLGMQAPLSHSG